MSYFLKNNLVTHPALLGIGKNKVNSTSVADKATDLIMMMTTLMLSLSFIVLDTVVPWKSGHLLSPKTQVRLDVVSGSQG